MTRNDEGLVSSSNTKWVFAKGSPPSVAFSEVGVLITGAPLGQRPTSAAANVNAGMLSDEAASATKFQKAATFCVSLRQTKYDPRAAQLGKLVAAVPLSMGTL